MICFEILSDFWRKLQKGETGKSGIFEFLRHSVGNQHRGVGLHLSVGCPHRGEAEVPKWNPSGTPRCSFVRPQRSATFQRSSATPRRSYCSRRNKFQIFVPKV